MAQGSECRLQILDLLHDCLCDLGQDALSLSASVSSSVKQGNNITYPTGSVY